MASTTLGNAIEFILNDCAKRIQKLVDESIGRIITKQTEIDLRLYALEHPKEMKRSE